MARAWLTPETLPAGLRHCTLSFPDSEEFHALVRGALFLLTQDFNFEQFGTLTPQETADSFRTMLLSFFEDDCLMIPPGVILPYGGSVAPVGYLLCDGSAISRILYADLFDVIGIEFGVGDGSTTFNLPDPRGRVLVGLDHTDGDLDLMGATYGEKNQTLSVGQLPVVTVIQNAHTHVQNAHTHVQNAHTHVQNAHDHNIVMEAGANTSITNVGRSGDGAAVTINSGSETAVNQNTTPTNQNTTPTNQNTTPTNQSFGSGQSHNNMQPGLVTNFIIKF